MTIWECEELILKKVWFEKEFTYYPHFIEHDFEARLEPLNEHLKGTWHIYQGRYQ